MFKKYAPILFVLLPLNALAQRRGYDPYDEGGGGIPLFIGMWAVFILFGGIYSLFTDGKRDLKFGIGATLVGSGLLYLAIILY